MDVGRCAPSMTSVLCAQIWLPSGVDGTRGASVGPVVLDPT